MLVYVMILTWSVLIFGAVHTYAYTFMNVGIIFAFCRYCIQWEKNAIRVSLPKLELTYLLSIFSFIILIYIVPLPQSVIQVLFPESARMNQLAQSPMQIVNHVSLKWGTLAVSNYPVRHAWVQYMVYVLFFWGLLKTLNDHKHLRQFSLLLIGIGTIESLYGLSQTFSNSGYILWVPKALFKNKYDTCGTFINRNHFAAMLTMLMLLSVAYSASQINRTKKTIRKPSFKQKLARFFTYEDQWNQKIIGIIAASIMGLGIYFSSSRGAVIAALPGVIILIAALAKRQSTRKQAISMIFVGLIILFSTVYIGQDRLIHRFNAIQNAMESRLRYVYSTMDLIKDYPIIGVGPANFTHAFARYQYPIDQQVTVTHAHNDWLQFVSEMGILGLICILVILYFFVKRIIHMFRKRRSSSAISLGMVSIAVLTSISAHSLFDFPLHIPCNMLIFIAICAIGFQSLHLVHHKKISKSMLAYIEIPLTKRYLAVWILIGAILISMTLLSSFHFIAELYCNTVPNSTLYRNQDPEADAIHKAIFWDPGNAVHWYKLAWRYIAYRNTFSETDHSNAWQSIQHKVLSALEQAVASNPCEAEYHIRLAWEYHRMQYHETGHQKQKRIDASGIAMKHASIVCGNKSYMQHMEIANYWNMRAAIDNTLENQETFWKKAAAHYRTALVLCPRQRCKGSINKQLKLYRRQDQYFHDIFQ